MLCYFSLERNTKGGENRQRFKLGKTKKHKPKDKNQGFFGEGGGGAFSYLDGFTWTGLLGEGYLGRVTWGGLLGGYLPTYIS